MRRFSRNYKVWYLHGETGYEYGSTSEAQPVSEPQPDIRFDKSSNGISRSINNMMYSMLHTGYSKWSVIPREDRELWFRQFAVTLQQEFTWESGLTETVRQKFNEKAMDSYTKQINAWKTVWQKNKRPRYINGTVWEQLIVHWEKDDTAATSRKNSNNRKSDRGGKGMYVHNLGACSMSSKEDQLAVPKRKGGRLVGLARRASSYPASSSQVPYTDPMILEQLQNKDERIVALEEQNATILSENATILAQLESQKKTNAEKLEKLDRLLPSGS
uniref:Uncharacterized protein n=1 Tax=Brassica oleracea var. oleracea TaxID=109376 RepID=A0A0D3BBT4_BRAOL